MIVRHKINGRARIGFGSFNGFVDRVYIVAIVHTLDMPAVGFKAFGAVFGEGKIGGAVNGNLLSS
jgi:hypothetical protein